jgi:hypothetical protein
MDDDQTMAVKGHTSCREAGLALEAVELFTALQRTHAKHLGKKVYRQREDEFLHAAREALSACDEESLKSLLGQMRGLSHYFCSYCSDLTQLDKLLDDFYIKTKEALVKVRSAHKSGTDVPPR